MDPTSISNNLRFIAIDNPAHFTGNPSVWASFGQCLHFRTSELNSMYPGENWIDASDLWSCHVMALIDGEPIAAMRLSSMQSHAVYGSNPYYQSIIDYQDHELRAEIESRFCRVVFRESERPYTEFSRLIVAKSLRGRRTGIKEIMFEATVYAGMLLGKDRLFTLSHEESGITKAMYPVGFRPIEFAEPIRHPTGSTSRILLCEKIDSDYMRKPLDKQGYFKERLVMHTRASLSPSYKTPYPTNFKELT